MIIGKGVDTSYRPCLAYAPVHAIEEHRRSPRFQVPLTQRRSEGRGWASIGASVASRIGDTAQEFRQRSCETVGSRGKTILMEDRKPLTAVADEDSVFHRSGMSATPRQARRVIVAYDGSDAARHALAHAADLVGRGGTVSVVNVIYVQGVGSRLETVSDKQRATQDGLLREAQQLLSRQEVDAELVRAAGRRATEILAAASSLDADVLVIGGQDRWMPHVLSRSLTGTLVRKAPCDVLVVH